MIEKKSFLLMILGLFLSLSACVAKFENVSNLERFKALVGKKYVTKKELLLIKTKQFEELKVRYSLVKPPGFAGYYVISTKKISAGLKFEIIKILHCINCVSSYYPFVISIPSIDTSDGDIHLYNKELRDDIENATFEWVEEIKE